MSKKRKSFREYKHYEQKHLSQTKTRNNKISTAENIALSILHTAGGSLSYADLQDRYPRDYQGSEAINGALDSLIQAGLVIKNSKKHFKLHKNAQLYEGKLVQHPKGFGFVNIPESDDNNRAFTRDPYISPAQMGGAHHGDTVLVRVLRLRSDGRPEGAIVRILTHGTNRIGGIYIVNGRDRLVYPDDRRFPFTIRIKDTGHLQPKHGDGVIAEFERMTRPAKVLEGKIAEILGPGDDVDTQMRLVIEQFNLPYRFSEEVLQEAAKLVESFPAEYREDLRTTAHVTIDGESAKDFDDAICVLKTRQGFRLFVSIADVSHFVTPGSAIDREAYSRGTSIYFPGRVIPMLPEKLSNNLCSLVPDKDRFTVSAILDFDRSGNLQKKRFCRSIIRSRYRFTYTTVQKILIDKDPAVRKEHKPFLTGIKWAGELATVLQKNRKKRGAIDFNLPEPEFTLTDSGKIASIRITERTFAHQLIEEFMLVANEAVAELFTQQQTPALFRIHEPPEPLKAEEFIAFAKTLNLPLAPFENDAAWFAETLDKCKDTKYEYIINNLLLRSMQQAKYSAKNVGHFGLATSDYTHFTSPIRRYPDLMVHRELLRLLPENKNPKRPQGQPSLKDAGEFLSSRERVAIMAERDMNDRLKIGYMKDRIGDTFEAIISGVTENGLYVEIQEFCISGSIPIEFLDDDYYLLDKKNYRLFGEISARTYQIGDLIRVTVTDVNILNKSIRFKLASNP